MADEKTLEPTPQTTTTTTTTTTTAAPPAGNGNGADASTTTAVKAVIKNVDMSDEMQQWTVDIAQEALQQFSVEKDIAAHIKRRMDSKCGPTWHVVAGQHFGSYVTHETRHFIYFYLGKVAFLVWRA
ncbi:unnamed protein product [Sympodiomycopsis kandeliae]